MDLFATHIPLLAACVASTTGHILELGLGEYSTPLLHAMALVGNFVHGEGRRPRLLVSAEHDRAWFRRFTRFSHRYHELNVVEDWATWECLGPDWDWDVVLCDHGPAAARKVTLARVADTARLIVLHDTEKPAGEAYGCGDLIRAFRYKYSDGREASQTTVLSNVDDLAWLRHAGQDHGHGAEAVPRTLPGGGGQ